MSKWGTRCRNERDVIQTATARGWERLPRNGSNHTRLRWPATGAETQIPSSMDEGFARAVLRRLQKMEEGDDRRAHGPQVRSNRA